MNADRCLMWHKPHDQLPDGFYAGDRLALIVVEREHKCAPLKPRIVMLTAREDRWDADDEVYGGYTPHDGVCWALEKDLLAGAADAYSPPASAPSDE